MVISILHHNNQHRNLQIMQNEQNQAYTQNQQNHHDQNLISCLLSVATVETVAAAPSFEPFLGFILLTIITMTIVKIFNGTLVQYSQFYDKAAQDYCHECFLCSHNCQLTIIILMIKKVENCKTHLLPPFPANCQWKPFIDTHWCLILTAASSASENAAWWRFGECLLPELRRLCHSSNWYCMVFDSIHWYLIVFNGVPRNCMVFGVCLLPELLCLLCHSSLNWSLCSTGSPGQLRNSWKKISKDLHV